MQTSKYGRVALTKSPIMISSFFCSGLATAGKPCDVNRSQFTHFPWTRFVNSAAMRGSISTAVTCFAFSKMRTVRLPVPGPTSSTLSVGRKLAYGSCQNEDRAVRWAAHVKCSPNPLSYQNVTGIEHGIIIALFSYVRLCRLRVFQDMLTESLGIEDRVPGSRGRCLGGRGF